MRIVHATDLHVDHGRHSWRLSNGDQSAAASMRRVLDAIAGHTIANDAALMVTGDCWMTANPRPEHVGMVADMVDRVAAAGLPVVFIGGNHELRGRHHGHRNPLDLLEAHGAHVATGDVSICRLPDGTPIVCAPWPDPTTATGDLADHHAELSARLAGQIEHAAGQVDGGVFGGHLVADFAAVGVGVRGTELTFGAIANEPVVATELLESGPWCVAALGHVHEPQQRGTVFYGGSPDRLDFAEERHDKAVTLIDPDTGGTTRLPTPARRLVTLTGDDIDSAITVAGDLADTVVRVVLPAGVTRLDDEHRRRIAAAGGRITRVETPRVARTRATPVRADAARPVTDLFADWAATKKITPDGYLGAVRTLTGVDR